MAHLIDETTGSAAVFTGSGKPAWHGLGVTIAGRATGEEARRLARIDWTVALMPLFAQVPDAQGEVRFAEVEKSFAVVRTDTNRPLGVVGSYFRPLQNAEAFLPVEEIVGAGAAVWETAGAINDGRRVWCLAKLPETIRTTNTDVSENYVLCTHAHDGSSAVRLFLTTVRVVCNNTLTAALMAVDGNMQGKPGRKGKAGVYVKHTGDVAGKLAERAMEYLGCARHQIAKMEAETRAMAAAKMTEPQVKELAEEFWPTRVRPGKELSAADEANILDQMIASHAQKQQVMADLISGHYANSERAARSNAEALDNILCNWETHNKDHAETAGTAWGALNAVTEYVDHGKDFRNPEKRFESLTTGAGSQVKAAVYQRALAFANSV